MRLQIPPAPRKVRLTQVPGAVRRLSRVSAVAALAAAALAAAGSFAGRWLGAEREFFARAVDVPAKVLRVALPRLEDRGSTPATLTVLYTFGGLEQSASGVLADAEQAEGLGQGAEVTLLVDPAHPDRPREARYAQGAAGASGFATLGVGLGLVLALGFIGLELKRAVRRELAPLRHGMLVWLTCEGALPQTRAETTFAAHYYRDDVKHEVQARARPGRAPVQNAGKVLAAVVPSRPTWVRVIDEDLARALGWFA